MWKCVGEKRSKNNLRKLPPSLWPPPVAELPETFFFNFAFGSGFLRGRNSGFLVVIFAMLAV